MKVAVEDISAVKKKLRIEVPSEDVAREMERALADIGRKAKIPGFRPGKAPKSVVERHYADDVMNDVVNRLVTKSYFDAVQQHRIAPVEMPEIADLSFQKGTPLSFSATVEVRPQFELGSYDGIEVREAEVAVTDEEVEQTIKRLREMYAHLEVVEGRPVEKGDTPIIDFEGFHEGKPIEGAKATDYMLSLGEGTLIPGFEDQLIGMQKGETRSITVTFPADYTNKDVAGKEARFTVTVKELKRAVVPELNDEFAKDIGNHQDVAELRARIREDIEARKRTEQAAAQREDLMKKLVDQHAFDVPPGMVERELQSMVQQQAMRMARQGMDVKTFDHVRFRAEQRSLAEKRVKGILLLDAVAEKEQVAVSDEEVTAELAAQSRRSNQPVQAIRKYYESLEGGLENLRTSLTHEKTLDLLLSRAKKSYN